MVVCWQVLDALAIKLLQHTATHMQHTASHCNSLIKSKMLTLAHIQNIIHQKHSSCSRLLTIRQQKFMKLHVDAQICARMHTILIVFGFGVY